MTKAQIRKLYLEKRLALTDTEFQKLNHRLCEQFFASVDLSKRKVVHTFLPIEKQKEVNTWLIIDRITKQYPHIQISIPRINNQLSIIENFNYEGPDQMEKNTWGIPEPKQGIPTPTEQLDTVLVPLLAFDKKGNRVGYGRGFYDKFLATCPSHCKKIGLSLFEAIDLIEGMGPHDLPLDIVITPDSCVNVNLV
jgi:5-formyltetrahydrofolate cyclo-ligase